MNQDYVVFKKPSGYKSISSSETKKREVHPHRLNTYCVIS